MRNVLTFLIAIIAIFFLINPVDSAEEEVKLTCETMDQFYSLWSDSRFGEDPTREKSAWLIHTPEGTYQWIRWPSSREWKKERWKGNLPTNLAAQVHTHPAKTDPKPSINDHIFSRKVNVPLYTVSRKGIWRTDPAGKVIKVAGSNWHMNLYKLHCKKNHPTEISKFARISKNIP